MSATDDDAMTTITCFICEGTGEFHHRQCAKCDGTGRQQMNTPQCNCAACLKDRDDAVGLRRMILCASCGNKRCPHATDHRHACTNSNETGQPGSSYAYPVTPKVVELDSPYGALQTIFGTVPNGARGVILDQANGYVQFTEPAIKAHVPTHWMKRVDEQLSQEG